ncbi:MAG TPA: translation initiation factor IF-2 [Solirubrobacteraceae bacterium]|nr:translation initiation factor IF-2 [Solirubrobacteraceae bacterium]
MTKSIEDAPKQRSTPKPAAAAKVRPAADKASAKPAAATKSPAAAKPAAATKSAAAAKPAAATKKPATAAKPAAATKKPATAAKPAAASAKPTTAAKPAAASAKPATAAKPAAAAMPVATSAKPAATSAKLAAAAKPSSEATPAAAPSTKAASAPTGKPAETTVQPYAQPQAAAAAPAPTQPGGEPATAAQTDGRTATEGEHQHKRPTRDSLQGERTPGNAGGRRRVVIDAQASRRAPAGPGSPGGGPAQPPRRQRRGRRRRGVYDEEAESRPSQTALATPDLIRINSGSTVKDVAEYLDVRVPEIVKKLMELGEMKTQTQTLSDETIEVLGVELGKEVEIVHAEDETAAEVVFHDADEDLVDRAPVVTIMGHVDHGKTSLLDAIRETEVAAGEAGGITQHIGAYQVHHDGHTVTFLDTPGHEAFTAMRARGAKVTDLAVIVVAADDGVKPQTQEAIDHAKAADVPMIVAVNKIDKEGADPTRVRTEMTQLGLQPVEWGGDVDFVDVSARTRDGLDGLLDTIVAQAEIMELRANPEAAASGTVIESKLDPGRGPVVSILIMRGTLVVGDALVAGAHWGRVRAMHDFTGARVTQALPGEPVEVLGFDGVPEAGERVRVVEHERRARQLAGERATRLKTESLARQRSKRISLEDIFGSGLQELNLVIKSDVAGSLEAIEDEIAKLPQDEVSVNVIRGAVGGVTESDVMFAAASDAVIMAFNVRPVGDARAVAEREGVEIRHYAVIYRAIEELRSAMQGMLVPDEVEEAVGTAEVRQIFRASRVGTIAGSHVTDGKLTRGDRVRLVRDGTVIYDGTIDSLRRFNDDVREVATDYDCGIVLTNYADVKEGDVMEAYTTRQVERELV